jgi:hypothetical protein
LNNSYSHKKWLLLPVAGILVFVLLYFTAAILYPGGSDFDKTAKGFSWRHNYWCELLASTAQNGRPNTARPVAIAAMAVLVISLIVFWYQIPGIFMPDTKGKTIIRSGGMGSMLVTPLLFTGFHDTVITIAGLFGCIAIILLLTRLFRHRMYGFFGWGILCLLLCFINNYVYYTKDFFYYLPVIQKISFVVFLYWFTSLTLTLYRKQKAAASII